MTATTDPTIASIGRDNTMRRQRMPFFADRRRPLSIALIALLVLLVIPPIVVLVRGSFAKVAIDGSIVYFTLDYYRSLFTNSRLLSSLANSLIFAGVSCIMSLLIGGTMAWIVERTNAPFKPLAYVITIISMGTPFVLMVGGWLFTLGPVGPVNQFYKLVTGSSENMFDVYSLTGMILIEGFHWAPLAFLLLASTFRASNADMEEAARMSGASVPQTIWRISLKLALPAILAVMLLSFIRSIEAFEVPALVGLPGRVAVLTTDIFLSAKQLPQDFGHSSAFSVVLLIIVSILFSFYGRLSRHAERYHSITGKGFRPRPLDLGGLRWVAGAFMLSMFFILVMLPVGAITWIAFSRFTRSFSVAGFKGLGFSNFEKVIADPYYLGYAVNTLILAAGTATLVMLLVAAVGWIAARRGPGAWLLDQLVTIPFIFPGIVLGVAVMQIYLNVPIPIYGTLWVILIAYIIKNLPYGMRYVYSGVLQIHKELEEAAAISGAGVFATLRRVVAPLLAPALLGGWLFIFLIVTRELSIAILLASPRSMVLSIVMYDMWTSGHMGELGALGLMWTAFMTTIALGFFMWQRKRQGASFA
jgi:iron(III) transport system permease protein